MSASTMMVLEDPSEKCMLHIKADALKNIMVYL